MLRCGGMKVCMFMCPSRCGREDLTALHYRGGGAGVLRAQVTFIGCYLSPGALPTSTVSQVRLGWDGELQGIRFPVMRRSGIAWHPLALMKVCVSLLASGGVERGGVGCSGGTA